MSGITKELLAQAATKLRACNVEGPYYMVAQPALAKAALDAGIAVRTGRKVMLYGAEVLEIKLVRA